MSYAQEYQQIRGNSMSKSNMYGNGPKQMPMEQLINQYNQIPIAKNPKQIRNIKSRNQYVVNEGAATTTTQ
jgi:hypothetical protein